MKKSELLREFEHAKFVESKYIGVAIDMPSLNEPEYIVNPLCNAKAKAIYYDNAYDDDCCLKANKDIRIVAVEHHNAPCSVIENLRNKLIY